MSDTRVILFGFNPDTNEPLDSRMVVETMEDRDNINPQVIFQGLITYVKENNTIYVYSGIAWNALIGLTQEQIDLIATIPSKSTVVPVIGNNQLVTALIIDGVTYRLGGAAGGGGGGGTSTIVLGTAGEVTVNTVGDIATVSLDTAITGAITANTAKTGITTTQAGEITVNTSKVGITTAQASAIINNTAKTGITTAQSSAITANTAKVSVAGLNQVGATVLSTDSVVYYAGAAQAPRRKTFNLVPNSIFNNDAGFITGITKANVDTAIGDGANDTDYYASDKTWKTIPSGGSVTKAAVDTAIGASAGGDATLFYNQQGNYVAPAGGSGGTGDYDDLTNKPIERLRTVETIVLDGTRGNVQIPNAGTNEFSTITLQNDFDSSVAFTALDTSSDLTYHTQLVAAGRWQFATSAGFSNGMVIADGTAWSTLGGLFLADSFLSGGTGIGTQVSVNDSIRITLGTGAATFTVISIQNVSNIVSAIELGTARDVVGTINGISTDNTTISFDAELISTGSATFSYDPDTANAVYNSAITDRTFDNPGDDITTNITQIANNIAALETDITWDGIVTDIPSSTTPVVSTSTTFVNAVPSNAGEWGLFTGAIYITPSSGDAWTTLNGIDIRENPSGTPLKDLLVTGDILRLTWGAGSADFIVNVDNVRVQLGVPFNIVGTIGRTFTNGESFTLQGDIAATAGQSSITLDLGTNTNINSSFSISGGLNNAETVVNTDAAPGMGSSVPATTITVTDADGMEVTSFTAAVSLETDSNIDTVGQQIANAVNANTETPIDFTATWDLASKTIVLTAASSGDTDLWTITFDNNGETGANAGNLSVLTQIQSGEIINEVAILTFPDGNSQVIALPSPPTTGTVTLQSTDGVLSWV